MSDANPPAPAPAPPAVRETVRAMDIELDDGQFDRLARYLDLLLDANERVNLTAVRDRDTAWHRLILDSLTLVPGLADLGPGATVIDVGTGGGLPGVPLAIACPRLKFTLLDSTGKKVKLVGEFIAALGLTNAKAMQERAETLGHEKNHRQRYDAAVSRAVGSVSEVLEYLLPLVTVGGRAMIIKGRKAEGETAAASDALERLGAGEVALIEGYPAEFPGPGGGVESELVIVSVIKERPTPKSYPRPVGTPRAMPL